MVKNHMDWCAKKNMGISHLGVHPDELRRDNICFDVFHMRSAITKSMMTRLRDFMRGQDPISLQQFSTFLGLFWGKFNVNMWDWNKEFNSFKGHEIAQFLFNTKEMVSFLQMTFEINEHLADLCNCLLLWEEISEFLHITKVDNAGIYNQKLEKFEKNVELWYLAGKDIFLTRLTPGDSETFYQHVVRFYMPDIAKITFERHGLGVGIFTMQGFERRNKESKNTLGRFTNGKGNLLEQNLKRLWDVFYHKCNAV